MAIEGAKWFTLQTLSGYEQRVATAIENMIEVRQLQDIIEKVVFVQEDVVEFKGGKKRKRQKKMLPSYIFVKMLRNRDVMYDISNIEGVLNFISNKNGPIVIPESEMVRILGKTATEKIDVDFKVNSFAKIIDGPFKDFDGLVREIYPDKARLKIEITVFGRNTPIELGFDQVLPITDRNE